MIQQNFNFIEIPKLSNKSMRKQNEFKKQLINQDVNIIYDFKEFSNSKLKS